MRRLTGFHNFTNLFKGRCAATGSPILQVYRPDSKFPVYSVQEWWGDGWDPLSFGRSYDFNRPMFEQFTDLLNCVPHPALQMTATTVQNCDYVNGVSYAKNCYLVFNSNNCEDCLYCLTVPQCTDCIDCSSCINCTLCSDCAAADNCYQLRHSFNCNNCRDSAFLWNCIGCQDCIGCVNLRQARFCLFNQQLTEKEFKEKSAELELDNYLEVERLWSVLFELALKSPQSSIRGHHLENASGDFLLHASYVEACFDGDELQECVNCLKVRKSHDCLDQYTWGIGNELIYNSSRVGFDCQRVICCYHASFGCDNVEYSFFCKGCRNCFGCVGLRGKEHCVFNKQYSKDDYNTLRTRIIAQMNSQGGSQSYGEYFPFELSRHPYNDSDAMLYFPLDQAKAAALGAAWAPELEETASANRADWSSIPARTRDINEDLTTKTFVCSASGKPFRLTAKEFRCYKERGLPVPRRHWRERLIERQARINPPILHSQKCARSGQDIESTYLPERGWQVWEKNIYTNEFF